MSDPRLPKPTAASAAPPARGASRATHPARGQGPERLVALVAFVLVLACWYCVLLAIGGGSDPAGRAAEKRAAEAMEGAIAAIRVEAESRGIALDPGADPNRTGLVGLSWTGLTTTLGSLPAKRTGAQPDAAALLARLLLEAGVGPGDRVAVDSSGSFPGFAVAALVAVRSLGAVPVAVVSVGSSTWGANRPEFALPDMLAALESRGILPRGAAAVSAGGGDDSGGGMDAEALGGVLDRSRGRGAALIAEPSLAQDVAARLRVFEAEGPIVALVSIGGNYSQAGAEEALAGRSGLLRSGDFPPGGPKGEGLIQACLRAGLPVIRILDVKDLSARTGLAYDPVPWPAPGSSALWRGRSPSRLLVAAGPVAAIAVSAVVLLAAKRRVLRARGDPGRRPR